MASILEKADTSHIVVLREREIGANKRPDWRAVELLQWFQHVLGRRPPGRREGVPIAGQQSGFRRIQLTLYHRGTKPVEIAVEPELHERGKTVLNGIVI